MCCTSALYLICEFIKSYIVQEENEIVIMLGIDFQLVAMVMLEDVSMEMVI